MKLLNRILACAIVIGFLSSMAYSGGDLYSLPLRANSRSATTTLTVTGANVDTIRVIVPANIATMSFFIYVQDSSVTDLVFVRRGQAVGTDTYYGAGIASTDTITAFTAWTNAVNAANPPAYKCGAVTLAPLCTTFDIVIDWGAACGTTASKPATVGVMRTFYYKE